MYAIHQASLWRVLCPLCGRCVSLSRQRPGSPPQEDQQASHYQSNHLIKLQCNCRQGPNWRKHQGKSARWYCRFRYTCSYQCLKGVPSFRQNWWLCFLQKVQCDGSRQIHRLGTDGQGDPDKVSTVMHCCFMVLSWFICQWRSKWKFHRQLLRLNCKDLRGQS